VSEPRATAQETAGLQKARRHPRTTQYDYLHLRYLNRDLQRAIQAAAPPVRDVLDIYCGARPYDDMVPPGATVTGFDYVDYYGLADIVSKEFLPLPDEAFDLVTCVEGFYYVPDPVHGVSEIRRVLRPGGTVVITVPHVWEYERETLEHRFTGPELERLFEGWEDVRVVENGGRAVAWTTLTGRVLDGLVPDRVRWRPIRRSMFFLLNMLGATLDRADRREGPGRYTLPMNLLLTARRPR
jgi:SAM-dependent methyltransferase